MPPLVQHGYLLSWLLHVAGRYDALAGIRQHNPRVFMDQCLLNADSFLLFILLLSIGPVQ